MASPLFDYFENMRSGSNPRNAADWMAPPQKPQVAGAPGAPVDPMAAARQRITDLTEGRGQQILNDPYQMAAMDFLKGQTSGTNVPYTDEVKNSILAQQGRGFASAEAAQMGALRDQIAANGGSVNDPSFQAAERQAMSQRQGQNLDAMGQMASQAGLANFQARNQGANQLAAARGAQNAQVNQMNLAGAGYRAQDFQETYHPPAAQPMPAPWFMAQMPQQQQQAPMQQQSSAAPAQPAAPRPQAPAARPVNTTTATSSTHLGGSGPVDATPQPQSQWIQGAFPTGMSQYLPPMPNRNYSNMGY